MLSSSAKCSSLPNSRGYDTDSSVKSIHIFSFLYIYPNPNSCSVDLHLLLRFDWDLRFDSQQQQGIRY
ncbi:hypothetical protein L2E82_37472 [Cichorium intybus]|uniref:Uncharacterized protein n=1 Tax=Cichorium intybus TaxID=13427 RepID=A0ACB9AED2_CICIN|nr:hypothetical protein L2E82_37472 [Cichorium intybus]